MIGSNDDFLDRLAAEAAPVRRGAWQSFAMLIGTGAAVSAAITIAVAGPRDDLGTAAQSMMFMWKLLAMFAIACAALVLLYRTGRPGASTRRLAKLPPIVAALVLLAPLAAVAMIEPARALDIRMPFGPFCVALTGIAAVPVWLAALMWLKAAAPTNLERASWAAGTASASVSAMFFVLHCTQDGVAYVTLWYGATIVGIAALTRLILPHLIRW